MMPIQALSNDLASSWQTQPVAARWVQDAVREFVDNCPEIRRFGDRLRDCTGTRLIDWIDHFALPANDRLPSQLEQAGFRASDDSQAVWEHRDGLFPRVMTHSNSTRRLAIKVESVADFVSAERLENGAAIEGEPLGPLRKLRVSAASDGELWAVERHGYRGWETRGLADGEGEAIRHHDEALGQRRRQYGTEIGFADADRLVRDAIADLGAGRASDMFFAHERRYWTARNRAAQFQKARQDGLGLGWGNHDHHTYRSSRTHFRRLVAVLEELGLVCRERFFAGREAGWGAQVMEQPESQVVVFADVDLSADEIVEDFAHGPLPPRATFGTVGLWCLLHGEAFLEAGMHHLECRFDFDAARTQCEQAGIRVMKPFTDFPHLKQAFTEGEIWPVDEARLEAALAAAAITQEQTDRFRRDGAVGSHLEILQRDEGYKGFNQSGINDIIRATDPRRQSGGLPGPA
jgi:hypothetical protein